LHSFFSPAMPVTQIQLSIILFHSMSKTSIGNINHLSKTQLKMFPDSLSTNSPWFIESHLKNLVQKFGKRYQKRTSGKV